MLNWIRNFGLAVVWLAATISVGVAADPLDNILEGMTYDKSAERTLTDADLQILTRVIDEQAARYNTLTEPDILADAWDHVIVMFVYALTAFLITCLAIVGIIGIAYIGGLRNYHHVREAVAKWPEYAEKNPELAGMILIAGGIVAGFTVLGIYTFMAHVSTPIG